MSEGYIPEETQYKIDFEPGHQFHGLEVTMGSLTVREYNAMMRRGLVTDQKDILDSNEQMMDVFASRIRSWNLKDRNTGELIPPTKENVDDQDRFLVGSVLRAWQVAMAGVSAPLEKGSPSGERSLEESLDLGSSSQNLQS